MKSPLISICIPVYNQPDLLVRCLKSIVRQNYKYIEVIISDDSPGKDIEEVLAPFLKKLSIRYFFNQPALKSPENWNYAIEKANGDLILVLHQDDWLHATDALSTYGRAFQDPSISLAFCRNTAVTKHGEIVTLQKKRNLVRQLNKKPMHLLFSQVIGTPSNLMFRSSIPLRFDNRFVWLVDVDFYIRLFGAGLRYTYIDQHLVSIGLHEEQMTVYCRNNPGLIFKENLLFASKYGESPFGDVRYFDYFWRLLRNHKIRTYDELLGYGLKKKSIPNVLFVMLTLQQRMPLVCLRLGLISKPLMLLCFFYWKVRSTIQTR